jgi:hypothetical protein
MEKHIRLTDTGRLEEYQNYVQAILESLAESECRNKTEGIFEGKTYEEEEEEEEDRPETDTHANLEKLKFIFCIL